MSRSRYSDADSALRPMICCAGRQPSCRRSRSRAIAWAACRAERMVTDSAGRQVEVPDRIERVFAAGPPASVLLYVLAPGPDGRLAARAAPRGLPYIAPEYRDLPELGWLTGRGDTRQSRGAAAAKPDLIFDFGSVRDTYVSLADRVQAQTGIPYVLIDGTFENTAAAVRLLGEMLGVEERAERIAAYVEAHLRRDRRDARRGAAGRSGRGSIWRAGRTASRPGFRARSTPRSSSGSARSTSPTTRAAPARHRQGPGRADRGLEPRYRGHLGPNFLRRRLDRLLLAGRGRGARRRGLSQPDRAVRLDRPAALAQSHDRGDVARGAVLPGPRQSGFAREDAVVLRPVLPCRPHRRRARPPPPVGRRAAPLSAWRRRRRS